MPIFPFGQQKPFYSDEEPDRESVFKKVIKYGAASLGVVGVGAAGFARIGSNERLMDYYYRAGRVAGYASPYGIFASLRIPELISPFLSDTFQAANAGMTGPIRFAGNHFLSDETLDYFTALTGRNFREPTFLKELQLHGLEFTRDTGTHGLLGRGSLRMNGKDIASNVMLMERDISANEPFNVRRNINQATAAAVSVVKEYDTPDDMQRILLNERSLPHRYIPVHSVSGEANTWKSFVNRLHYPRGIFAFYAQRLNEATRTIGESIPVVGEYIRPLLKGEGLTVKSGPGLKMYGRLFGLTAKVGALYGLFKTYDWYQRHDSDSFFSNSEKYLASSVFLGSYAYGMQPSLLKHFSSIGNISRGRFGTLVGGVALTSQMLLPGFNKGPISGISQTASSLDIVHASIGQYTYFPKKVRETMEDVAPGITSNSTTIAAGLVGYGAFQFLHRKEASWWKYSEHLQHLQANHFSQGIGLGMLRSWTELFTNPKSFLDTRFTAWQKVANNLGITDDLKTFYQQRSAGQWRKDVIPYQTENKLFEQVWETMGKSGAPLHARAWAATEHLMSSSNARFKGLTGGVLLFGMGMLSHMFMTGKLFGARLEDVDTLRRQAAGEEDVAVRKSRFWGAGGTPYAGGKIAYYRPSLNALIQSDAYDRALWGDEVDKYNPITRFFLKNFTYHLEEKHAYDRPYPVSSAAFADVPIIGPILGATIGRLIKPPRLYRTDEWMDERGYLNIPKSLDSNPAIDMGGTGIGRPERPTSFVETWGNQIYKFREAAGLLGFIQNSLQVMVTGEETLSSGRTLYDESNRMWSMSNRFWELELGGAASLSEIPRRYFTKERPQNRNRYNPIRNEMPSWMPVDFSYGDPYNKVMSGYARLPGPGYAALHPELEGIDPEDYPLIHRYNILANIASYSEEFSTVRNKLASRINRGAASPEEKALFEKRQKELRTMKLKRNYFIESEEQKQQPYPMRLARRTYFNMLDSVKLLASPIEYLTIGGARPFQKFLPTGNVLDDYKNYAIYGSETSFWTLDKSWSDYFRPALLSVSRIMGWSGVPSDIKEERNVNEYFDKMTYYKYMRLAERARASGDNETASRYERYAHKTVYGLPGKAGDNQIMGALPVDERERFEGFKNLIDQEDIAELISLVPEDQKAIYSNLFARKAGVPSTKRPAMTDNQKMRLLEAYYEMNGAPSNDWIGWNPEVDLNDIKLKYIQEQEMDPMSFGYWPNDMNMLKRKPYLRKAALPTIDHSVSITKELEGLRIHDNVYMNKTNGSMAKQAARIIVNDDRHHELESEYQRWNER